VITQVDSVQIIDGTATKVRLRLAYGPHTRRDGLPDQMCIKGGFGAHREYLGGMGLYGRAGLDALAALHGQSWGDDRPRRLGVEPLLSDATEPILRDFLVALPERFAAPRGFAAPVVLHQPDRLRAAYAAYRAEVQRGAVCLVHGDAHIGNAYVEPDGRVGFVDWQTVAVGPWVHDVNYFLVSALDVPDRRAHERDLLGHYLKALATFGVSIPGLDEAWSAYRRATVHGFLGWLCNLDVWQPAEVNTATYARFGMAMIDHDTYAALGV
jgi:Phosphotransferase enzyme family